MNCEQIRTLIHPYIDGELGDLESRRMERHLGGCKSCASEVYQFRQVRELIATHGGEDAPLDLLNELRVRMEKERTSGRAARRPRRIGRFALVACFALALLGGLFINAFDLPSFKSASHAPEQMEQANNKSPRADAIPKTNAVAFVSDAAPAASSIKVRRARRMVAADSIALEKRAASEETRVEPTAAMERSRERETGNVLRASRKRTSESASPEERADAPERVASAATSDLTKREIVLEKVRRAFDLKEIELERERILRPEERPKSQPSYAEPRVVATAVPVAREVAVYSAPSVERVAVRGGSAHAVTGGFSVLEEVEAPRAMVVAAHGVKRKARPTVRALDAYHTEDADAASVECARVVEEEIAAREWERVSYIRYERRIIIRGHFDAVSALRSAISDAFSDEEPPAAKADPQNIPPDAPAVLEVRFIPDSGE